MPPECQEEPQELLQYPGSNLLLFKVFNVSILFSDSEATKLRHPHKARMISDPLLLCEKDHGQEHRAGKIRPNKTKEGGQQEVEVIAVTFPPVELD